MIKVCDETYEDPSYCKNFDHDDEICNCVHQLKNLRDGYVMFDESGKWIKREDAIKLGYGTKEHPFELGINVDGTGLDEPDWVHVHGNCLTILVEVKKID